MFEIAGGIILAVVILAALPAVPDILFFVLGLVVKFVLPYLVPVIIYTAAFAAAITLIIMVMHNANVP